MILRDLSGKRFGKLTVIRRCDDPKRSKRWVCKCDCGNEIEVFESRLLRRINRSCGYMIQDAAKRRIKDITGMRFGSLVVLRRSDHRIRGKVSWLCKCDCGKYIDAIGSALRSGNTKSCGCLKIDELVKRSTKHNKCYEREYSIWSSMKQRCLNSKARAYKWYGGRGIKICDRWLNDDNGFSNFLKDMGNAPPDYSIDRIDPNGNYEPSNCRWASWYQQSRNKTNSHFITVNGITKNITDWSNKCGISRSEINHRMKDLGWSAYDAINTKKYEVKTNE